MHTDHENLRNLLIAVIIQAIDDAQRQWIRHPKTSHEQNLAIHIERDRADAAKWLSAEPSSNPEPLSFQWCCQHLDLNYRTYRQHWLGRLRPRSRKSPVLPLSSTLTNTLIVLISNLFLMFSL